MRIRAAALVAFALTGWPAFAPCQSNQLAAPRHPSFELFIVGEESDAESLRASLRESVGRLGLTMHVTTLGSLDPAVGLRYSSDRAVSVQGFIDLRAPEFALIILSDPKQSRPAPVRRVDQDRNGSRALLLEEVAYVTGVGLESILASEPERSDEAPDGAPLPAEPASPKAAPATTPALLHEPAEMDSSVSRASRSVSFDVLGFGVGETIAKDHGVSFGTGIGGELHFRNASWPSILLLGAYHQPVTASTPIDLSVTVWSLRIAAMWPLVHSKRVLVESGIGAGVDLFAVSSDATVNASIASLDANRNDISPILSAMLRVQVAIRPNLGIFADGLIDWNLTPRTYVAAVRNTHDAILQMSVPRPGFTLGLCYRVAGDGS